MGAEQALKRIPRIKFPQRHCKPPASGSIAENQATSKRADIVNGLIARSSSDVPAPPVNTAAGGKASLLPKRTPVSEREIEAILLGGCF
ncbi:NADH-dependent glutamate synthase 1 isoform 1 [Hibiscus syriacus]|uniref:NADH-dependent glutamate synthase 1 isoform 1 n=1 Tax=Hibiscus syriacus TaxID=106335 RepID=A0A6A2XYR4_HIBSY|nr:NADH-dependent glutamate synthase 1 isoform 1 [Hibiscus syriacus]